MRKASTALCIVLISALYLMSFAGGCKFAAVDPGSDPIVVNAERSTQIAFDDVDAFVKFESENQALIKERAPAVHAAAERLRRDAPAQFRRARELTRLYKQTRNATDGKSADDQLATVQQLAHDARKALIDAQAIPKG